MVALLVLIMVTLEIFERFLAEKPFDAKGVFGDNVIKNAARYIIKYSFQLSR